MAGQPQAEILSTRARLLARAAVADGVAAVNVGRRDLAAGLALLAELGREPGVPWVSTNLRAAAGEYPFPRWRVVPWGDALVGVVGLLAPNSALDRQLGLRTEDPAAALREVLPLLPEVAAVVCLSNLGLAAEQSLARAFPQLTLVVGGGSSEYLPTPPVEGNAVVLRAGDRGRYLGVLDLPSAGLRSWRAPRDLQQEGVLQARLHELRRQAAGGQDAAEAAALRQETARTEASLAALGQATAVFAHRIVVLDGRGGEDPRVLGWLREYRELEMQWQRGQAGGGRPSPPGASPAPGAAPQAALAPGSEPLHAGSASCRECHAGAYQGWARTRHARAYASLQGSPRDPSCLACHASTVQRATGTSLEPVVGCEACHGPGGRHRGPGNIARKPGEAVCARCHRGFHEGKAFDFAKAYGAIRCDRGEAGGTP